MSDTAKTENLEPLYKRDYSFHVAPWTYRCAATGCICERATSHFQEYAAFVKELSDSDSDKVFLHGEPNLCIDPIYCTIWDMFMKSKTR